MLLKYIDFIFSEAIAKGDEAVARFSQPSNERL